MKHVPLEVVRSLLIYDRETGEVTWAADADESLFKSKRSYGVWFAKCAGKPAGFVVRNERGYRRMVICIQGKRCYLHKIIWLHVTGRLPDGEIDHIDRDATNNKWANLREGTHGDNTKNRSLASNNVSGHSGVSWSNSKQRWVARVKVDGRPRNRFFREKEDAIAQAKEWYRSLGFSHGHGKEAVYAYL